MKTTLDKELEKLGRIPVAKPREKINQPWKLTDELLRKINEVGAYLEQQRLQRLEALKKRRCYTKSTIKGVKRVDHVNDARY